MINWTQIQTVLLDMDGTLLDLHYDNYFWLTFVPQQYAQHNSLSIAQAQQALLAKYRAVEGTMDWYCVDYWSHQLDMDIAGLKARIKHLIAVHPGVIEFLTAMKNSHRQVLLVTNAHPESLTLKMAATGLGHFFDDMVCAHDYGAPKEMQAFWHAMHHHHPFEHAHTLFVDDSLPVLRSAKQFGINHLLAIRNPDSQGGEKNTEEFHAVTDFGLMVPQDKT